MTTGSVPLAPACAPSVKRDYSLGLVLTSTLLLWSTAFVGIRYAVVHYPPGSLALLRFLVASTLLALYFYFPGRQSPKAPASLRDRASFLALGATGIFGYHVALNFGERTVSAGAASLIVNTTPIFTVILAALLLGERLPARGGLGFGVSFAGAVMVSLGAGSGVALDRGALLVLLAAVLQALYFTLQKPLLRRFGALELTARSSFRGCLLLGIFLPELFSTVEMAPPSATLVVLFLGVGPSAAGYLAWSHVVSRMSVSEAVGYLYLVPVLALAIGWLLLGETPGLLSVAGGTATLAGVWLLRNPLPFWKGRSASRASRQT